LSLQESGTQIRVPEVQVTKLSCRLVQPQYAGHIGQFSTPDRLEFQTDEVRKTFIPLKVEAMLAQKRV
jgi:hypothetical protein